MFLLHTLSEEQSYLLITSTYKDTIILVDTSMTAAKSTGENSEDSCQTVGLIFRRIYIPTFPARTSMFRKFWTTLDTTIGNGNGATCKAVMTIPKFKRVWDKIRDTPIYSPEFRELVDSVLLSGIQKDYKNL